jgi:hypothetical protein
MARPPLPPGLLDVYRDVTWVNPVGTGAALDALLDWLDEHPVDGAALLPKVAAFLKTRRDL